MSESTFLIKSYLHSRKAGKLSSVISQTEEVAAIVARILEADFVAVFYRSEEGERLIPLALHSDLPAAIADIRELETRWRDAGNELKALQMHRSDIVYNPDTGTDDRFAERHGFRKRLVCPGYEDEQLRALFVAYWTRGDLPDAIDANRSALLDTALKLLVSTMHSVNETRMLTDYSLRLSDLIAMFEIPVEDQTLDELVGELTGHLRQVSPRSEYTLFLKDPTTGEFRFDATASGHSGHKLISDKLKTELPAYSAEFERIESISGTFKDVAATIGEPFSYAYLIPFCRDNAAKYILCVWSTTNAQLSENDRELLSIYSLFTQMILKDALLVRNLTRANRLLKKSSRQLANLESLAALADMTSGVAHDFNNMIGGVVGRIQLMKLKVKDPGIITDLNKIEAQVLEGAETIRRIQEFTTSAKNKKLKKIDLLAAMKSYFDRPDLEWKKVSESKNISVSIKSYVEIAEIEGAPEDITLLFEKLIENAVHFAKHDSTVEVVLAEERKQFVISVTDKGPVIPESIRKKIFYPFFTTKGSNGAGMGLAIVHGIVVRHGGKVELTSDEVNGTTFRLIIPGSDAQNEDSDISRKHGKLGSLKIIVVDDDEQIREVLSDMLTIDGHQITTCEDGYVALKQCQEHRFDLMITDLGMPGMSGLDLAGQVHESDPTMPIAMITGWGTQLNQDEVALKGVKAVLPKPFHLKDIKALITELVVEA